MTPNSSMARKPSIKPKPPNLQGNIIDRPDQDYLLDNLLDEDDDLAPPSPTFKTVDPPKPLRQRGTPDGSPRLVIAIDYGTTFTSVAFATPRSDIASLEDIEIVTDWGPQMGNHSKIPSVYSYSPAGSAGEQQWGSSLSPDAVTMVNTKMELDVQDNKLDELELILQVLDGTRNLEFDAVKKSGGYPEYPGKNPEEIVTDYMTKVFQHLNQSFELFGSHLKAQLQVDIVITVPLKWSYRAKNSTVRAIKKAGFNEDTFPNLNDIIVVTEQEAAAIYTARYLKEDMMMDFLKASILANYVYPGFRSPRRLRRVKKHNLGSFGLPHLLKLIPDPTLWDYQVSREFNKMLWLEMLESLGECFILCDAGGRTVDVISYKVKQLEPTLELEEMTIATGAKCGSAFIDANFKRWLQKVLGDRYYRTLDPKGAGKQTSAHTTEGKEMRELIKAFDARKKTFSNDVSEVKFDLPTGNLDKLNIPGKLKEGELTITREEMRGLFDPCVDRVVELIMGQIQQVERNMHRVMNVFLVGGFGESPYLQEELKLSLALRKITMRRPDSAKAETAAVQGAVIYGIEKCHHKNLTTHPRSYLVATKPPPPSTKESEDETITTDYEGTVPRDTDGRAESTLPTTVSGKPNESKREADDTLSTFTDDQSLGLPEIQKTSLIKDIATKIWDLTAVSLELQEDYVARISAALPELLKELSLELSCTADTITQRRAVAFIRRHRGYITNSFQASRDVIDVELESRRRNSDGLTVEEKMSLWNITESDPKDTPIEDTTKITLAEVMTHVDQAEHDEGRYEESENEKYIESDDKSEDVGAFDGYASIPDLPQAWAFVFGSEAFSRLLKNIQTVSILTPRQGQIVQIIRNKIIETISSGSPLRESMSSATRTSSFFQISWDPLAFLKEQYEEGDRPQIKDIITLSGEAIDAQATACGQYIQQVWPSIGMETLEAVQGAINQPDVSCISNMSDGTELDVRVSGGLLLVNATGTTLKLADIGEQLSWIGASCRVSPYTNRIVYCTTSIIPVRSPVPSFVIDFHFQDLEDDSVVGSCWRHLFKNPVIARGFPVLARSNNENGLEIPLNMMARLGGAERATVFDGQLLIKGFSTMFVPTKRIQNSILWHFLFNRDNSRISYSSAKQLGTPLTPVDVVNYQCLPTARMFLGWASSVSLYTGTGDVDYTTLGFTGSNFSTSGCVLEKVTISAGKFITGGATFARGIKDSILSLSNSDPYDIKMESASTWNVVLYDVDDRRAWLVDGANALLHLTRARLSQKQFSKNLKLDLEKFPHADCSHGRDAALKALEAIAENNQVLIAEKPSFGQPSSAANNWGLKDIVLGYWHILEQIQDHQRLLSGAGMSIRLTDREKLEGFGFVDIISGRTAIRPRVAYLESGGRGWVDFLREIQAITLMARGFGELIRPTNKSNPLCKAWKQVPTGKDYLVARISQLHDICEFGGNAECRPLELVQGVYWHQGGQLFEPCSARACLGKCDRIQVLLPKVTLGFKKYPDGLFAGDMEGAVLFGYSRKLPKFWPRNPKSGPLDNEAACIAEDSKDLPNLSQQTTFHDSGLGTEDTDTPSDEVSTRRRSKMPFSQRSDVLVPTSDSPAIISGELGDGQSNSEPSVGHFDSDNLIVLPPIAVSAPRASRKGKAPIRNLGYLMDKLRMRSRSGSVVKN